MTNSIIWDANVNEIFEDITSLTTITFSDVFGSWPGAGNIELDPLFATGACDDLRLSSVSPCIDAGDNALLPSDTCDLDGNSNFVEPIPLDLAGDPRVVDGDGNITATTDMGAYEHP